MWSRAALVLGGLAAAAHAAASDAPAPEAVRAYPDQQRVYALAEDPDGFLWLAAERALLRFDGVSFERVSPPGRQAYSALAISGLGRVVAAFQREHESGLVEVRRGQLVPLTELSAALAAPVTGMAFDADGTLWAGARTGLWRARDAGPPERGLVEPVHALAVVRGHPWVATAGAVLRRGGDGFSRVAQVSGVVALVEHDEAVLAVTRDGSWCELPVAGEAAAPACTSLGLRMDDRFAWGGAVTYRGGLLVGAAGGLVWTEGAPARPWVLPGARGDAAINALYVDRSGDLWVATDYDGLLRVRQDPIARFYGDAEGISPPVAFGLARDAAGTLWWTRPPGLGRIAGDEVELLDVPRELELFSPRAISVARDGTVWFGALAHGLGRYAKGRFSRMRPGVELPPGRVAIVFHDRAGDLWIGMDGGGLFRRAGATWQEEPGARQACPATIVSLAEVRGDHPAQGEPGFWFATAGAGLCRWSAAGWRRLTVADGLPEDDLRSLFVAASGDVWIGGNREGLARLRDGRVRAVPLELGLNLEEISGIVDDAHGHLWLSSPVGLFRIDPRDVDAVLAGELARVPFLEVGPEDGLRSRVFIAQYAQSALRDEAGALWFPNLRGVVRVDPARVRPAPAPVPRIEDVRLDGASIGDGAAPVRAAQGHGNLSVRFSVADLRRGARVGLSFRLGGFESAWRPSAGQREASYANLPPGRYQFQVRAEAPDMSSPRERVVAIDLTPPLHATAWFRALLSLCAVLVALAGWRLRRWRARARQAVIADERARIARDLHDTLEQSLTGLKLQMESLRRTPDDAQAVRSFLDRGPELIAQATRDLKGSIWALRAAGAGSPDLRTALSVVAGRALRGTDVAFHLEVTGTPRRLEPEAEQQILRIVQEGLTNALKHARAGRIELALRFADGADHALEIELRDDGQGFAVNDPGAGPAQGHFGLAGMRERAARLGAEIEWQTQPGAGTRLRLGVPARWRRGG